MSTLFSLYAFYFYRLSTMFTYIGIFQIILDNCTDNQTLCFLLTQATVRFVAEAVVRHKAVIRNLFWGYFFWSLPSFPSFPLKEVRYRWVWC